jgi:hypothetical protein
MDRTEALVGAKMRLDLILTLLEEIRELDRRDEELQLAGRWMERQRERVAAAQLDELVSRAGRDDESRAVGARVRERVDD